MIPHQIIQTSRESLPDAIVRRTMRTAGSLFDYRHFDDAKILRFFEEHPINEVDAVTRRFLSLRSGEHKADLFRYYYLYVCGGIYFDTDVLIVTDLKSYICDNNFVSVNAGNVRNALFQGFLAAAPGHPILLRAVLDVCETSDQSLALDHHILCKNLKRFLDEHLEKNSADRNSTLLLSEVAHNRNVAKSLDENGNPVLYHFWKRRYPPRFPISVPGAKWAF